MRLFSILCISTALFVNSDAYATVKVAVIDTGFYFHDKGLDAHLCADGHRDFSNEQIYKNGVPRDINSHGTNIAGIIDFYGTEAHVDFCIVVIKYYSAHQSGSQNLEAVIKAFNYAADMKYDIINISGGGQEREDKEYAAVERFLNGGGKIFAAAGNDGKYLGKNGYDYYPAMYDPRIIVVGNLHAPMIKSETSNYGTWVSRWEYGERVNVYGISATGTSQATAVVTGKSLAKANQGKNGKLRKRISQRKEARHRINS